jgi:DNA-binding HxlR family transcriptional regulator
MEEMLAGIHEIVGDLMYAENFIIVRYDGARQVLRFIYFVDSKDGSPVDALHEYPESELANSLTLAMMKQARPVMGSSAQLREEFGIDNVEGFFGPDSVDWLGVPMLAGNEVRGGIVVQTYDDSVRYTEEDRALLSYVAQHILTTLLRREAHEELEDRVERRTRELRVQIAERERGERLQAAYRHIAEAATRRRRWMRSIASRIASSVSCCMPRIFSWPCLVTTIPFRFPMRSTSRTRWRASNRAGAARR